MGEKKQFALHHAIDFMRGRAICINTAGPDKMRDEFHPSQLAKTPVIYCDSKQEVIEALEKELVRLKQQGFKEIAVLKGTASLGYTDFVWE